MICTRDEPLLTVDDVCLSYGSKEVLKHISVSVPNLHVEGMVAGQVVALLGPSGCGKSQLVRTIAGLQKPTSGGVYFGPSKLPVMKRMAGVVFQSYPLFNHRTVLSNLELAGRLAGMPPSKASARARHYLELFTLNDCMHSYPVQISGGMRQRVAVSQQLMNLDESTSSTPRVVLMDEPFAALDYQNTRKTCGLIRYAADISDTNTIIVVTHDIRAALLVADWVWVMSQGRIVREIDLVEPGLTWHPELEGQGKFLEMERCIVDMFKTL